MLLPRIPIRLVVLAGALIGAASFFSGCEAAHATGAARPPGVALDRVPAPVIAPAIRGGEFPAEPFYDSTANVPLWIDDFEGGGAQTLGKYVTLGQDFIHVDSGAGIDGSTAMRFDWVRSTKCTDDSHLIEHNFPNTPELFLQFSVRYTPGFVFDWRGDGPCVGNAKKIFFVWADSGSRFDVISENHAIGAGSDNDHPLFPQIVDEMTPEHLADGNWHRFTFHIRQSSTPSATDGLVQGWIDGKLKWSRTAVATNNSGGYYDFKVPTTFNQGSPATQSEWLDNLRIWR